MGTPGVRVETLHNPLRYTQTQVELACQVAALLNRGKLVLALPPGREEP
jgi:hypothetical protein